MLLVKRLSLLCALVTVLVLGMGASGEAQIRRGRTVIVAAASTMPTRSGTLPGSPYGYGVAPYQYPIGRYPAAIGSRIAIVPSASRSLRRGRGLRSTATTPASSTISTACFQRLRLPPGSNELTLYRDGFRTVHQTVYLTADSTFRSTSTWKLAAGDVPSNARRRGWPHRPSPGRLVPTSLGPGPAPGQPRRAPLGRRGPCHQIRAARRRRRTLAIRVQPGNATVTIDGERWDGPQGQDRLHRGARRRHASCPGSA